MRKNHFSAIKKLMALIMAFTMAVPTGITANVFAKDGIKYGDVNGDGTIDASDALAVLKHVAKLEILDDLAIIRADVDGENGIDASDALWILKYSARLVDSFPVMDKATAEPSETTTPEASETATPEASETFTPEASETATPKPSETTTPEASETATPKPSETATPEPTATSVVEENTFSINVSNSNNAAVVDGNKLTFANPNNYKDGVQLENPFIGKDTSKGLAISFWMTPSETVEGAKYDYRSIFTVLRSDLIQAIKFDLEGTRQLSTLNGDKLNYWGANTSIKAGTEYFITFVVNDDGLDYYINGKSIGHIGYSASKSGEDTGREAAKALFAMEGTKLYAGGVSTVDSSLQGSSRLFDNKVPEGTVMRDFKGYLGNYTASDVEALYKSAVSGSENTPTAQPTVAPTVAPTVTPTVAPTVAPTVTPSEDAIAFSGTLYIASDSIADGYDNRPVAGSDVVGWGNIFSNYFTSAVKVDNQANLGDSTKSYWYDYNNDGIGDGHRYKAIYDNLKKNDYVMICFGHNDGPANRNDVPVGKDSSEKGCYQWYLKEKYIEPALAVGATPILMTPVVRCFYKNGVFYEENYHLAYGQAVRDLVAEYAAKGITIPLIDTQKYTYDLYQTLSESEAKKYHATNDTTHYNQTGCERLCEYIISEFKKLNLGINQYIK